MNCNDSFENTELECLTRLKNTIKESRELDYFLPIFDEKFLLHFVYGAKLDSKKAYKIITNYISVWKSKSDLLSTIRPSTEIGLKGIFLPLRHTDHLNRLVMLDRNNLWDPSVISYNDLVKLGLLAVEEIWNSEEAEKNGIVIIFDLAGWNMSHSRVFTPATILDGLSLLLNNFPMRYKGIHFVNQNLMFTMLLKTVKMFVPKKLRERIHLHSNNLPSLHAKVSSEILPKSLGGALTDEEALDDQFEERIRAKDNYYQMFNHLIAQSK